MKNIFKQQLSLFLFIFGLISGFIYLWTGLVLERGNFYSLIGALSIFAGLFGLGYFLNNRLNYSLDEENEK